jgi:membrane-bound serine protease (ClpP class)
MILFLLLAIKASFACTLELTIDDYIGVGTSDYFSRATEKAREKSCDSILVKINTPGGDLHSTRKIVTTILNSPKPFLCIVHPTGGHAGSAGAIILQACHINGAIRATNLGAATPVSSGGQEIPEDLKKKIFNDTISWLEGITKARGRNLEFSKEIITEAKAVTAEEAARIKAIDITTNTLEEFLTFAHQKNVKDASNKDMLVTVGSLETFDPDLRYKILQTIADPQLSYMAFLGSLGLLYFEFTHPGAIVPGVIGGLGLVLSFIAFDKLDVQWGGLALLLLGILFFVLEAMLPSFGVLGLGGVVAFTIGGLLLYDESSGYALPLSMVLPVSILVGALMFGLAYLAFKTKNLKPHAGTEDVIGESLEVIYVRPDEPTRGEVFWKGERWAAQANAELVLKQRVEVVDKSGLTLIVKVK